MASGDEGATGTDFFVSYTQVDRPWAEWIAWALEEAGYRVLIQAWDFAPGSDWAVGMKDGMARAARTVAVLSENYARSPYGTVEWWAAWSADPAGRDRKLLVVRVADCARPGPLNTVVSIDVFGMAEDAARTELLNAAERAISGTRAKPKSAPPFPPHLRAVPAAPGFPGADTAAAGRVRPPAELLPSLPARFVPRENDLAVVRGLLVDPAGGAGGGCGGDGGCGQIDVGPGAGA